MHKYLAATGCRLFLSVPGKMDLPWKQRLPLRMLSHILLCKGTGQGSLLIQADQMLQQRFHHVLSHTLPPDFGIGHYMVDVDQAFSNPGKGDMAHGDAVVADGRHALFFKGKGHDVLLFLAEAICVGEKPSGT